MNDNHKRHIVVTFQYINKLLADAEAMLNTQKQDTIFSEFNLDLPVEKHQEIKSRIELIRNTMLQLMKEYDLPQPKAKSGALWGIICCINSAQIALVEIDPKRMEGYGRLTAEDAKQVEKINAELKKPLDSLMIYLSSFVHV